LKTANENIDMVLNLTVGPSPWKSDAGRMKDVFSDGQFGQNNVILRDVANDLAISGEMVGGEL
jgi:hypothetical protein